MYQIDFVSVDRALLHITPQLFGSGQLCIIRKQDITQYKCV